MRLGSQENSSVVTHSFLHILPVLTVCLSIGVLIVLARLIMTVICSCYFRYCLKLLFYSTVESNFYPLVITNLATSVV